jgi:alpha-L-rhamnosidase
LSEIPERAYYVTHDITAALRRGPNVLGVVLGNGRFYAPRRGAPFGEQYPKLMLKLVIDYQDGSQETVVSDGQWQITDRGEIRTNNDYDGEEVDGRMELRGWSEPGYAAKDWQPAPLVSPAARHLSAAMFPPMRVTGLLHPVSVKQIGPQTYVYDFGQNMVGHCVVRVKGPRGAEIKLRHAETVGPDGVPHFENLRTAMSLDSYILKGEGDEVFEPRFASHGFRFVELTGYPGTPDLSVIDGKVVGDDLEHVGEWTSSNPLLNQIYRNMAWGIRGNYHSIPTDCPQRDERQGWTGDRVFESKGEAFVFDTAPLYHKWFQDMADTQRADGSLSDVAPSYFPYFNQDVTWAGAFVMSPEALYEQFGDPTFFALHYPEMKRWVEHMETFLAQGGIVPNDRYGDWCPPPDINRGLIHMQSPLANPSSAFMGSTHFYVVLRLMERYAHRLGHEDEAAMYRSKADQFKLAFNRRFLSADGHHYDTGSQTSYILPLAFDLVPAEARAGMQQRLIDRIKHEDREHVNLGLVGVQQLMRTLSDAGQADLAYRIAVQDTYPSWGYMVRQGATTVWELWNGDTADVAMNSGNHVMLIGDCVIWLYENVAGIKSDPAHPGFKHILMRPTPVGDLTSARAQYRSPYGQIVSDWRKTSSGWEWNVVVPANTTATLEVPAASADQIAEGGRAVAESAGIKIAGKAGDRVQLEVGSGSYHFMTLGSR